MWVYVDVFYLIPAFTWLVFWWHAESDCTRLKTELQSRCNIDVNTKASNLHQVSGILHGDKTKQMEPNSLYQEQHAFYFSPLDIHTKQS